MGRNKKKIKDLQKNIKTMDKVDMKKIIGGKKGKRGKFWNGGCGGILPQ